MYEYSAILVSAYMHLNTSLSAITGNYYRMRLSFRGTKLSRFLQVG